MNREDRRETAEVLKRIVDAVDEGVLAANSRLEKRIVRRIEGASALLGAEAGLTPPSDR